MIRLYWNILIIFVLAWAFDGTILHERRTPRRI